MAFNNKLNNSRENSAAQYPNKMVPKAPESIVNEQDYLKEIDELSNDLRIDRDALYDTFKDKKGVLSKRFNSIENHIKGMGFGLFGGLFSSMFVLSSTFDAIQSSDLTEAPYISGPIFAFMAWMAIDSVRDVKQIKKTTVEDVNNHLKTLPVHK